MVIYQKLIKIVKSQKTFFFFKSEDNSKDLGKNISYLFYNCSKLKYLPDISKWNTIDVVNMIGLFSGCSNLISLPDISKWKTDNVNDLSFQIGIYLMLLI